MKIRLRVDEAYAPAMLVDHFDDQAWLKETPVISRGVESFDGVQELHTNILDGKAVVLTAINHAGSDHIARTCWDIPFAQKAGKLVLGRFDDERGHVSFVYIFVPVFESHSPPGSVGNLVESEHAVVRPSYSSMVDPVPGHDVIDATSGVAREDLV